MSVMNRLAMAPISWGVCPVPGWGAMLPSDRVLSEMRSLGQNATELGAPGFLPAEKEEVRELLTGLGMQLVGTFVPLVLHRESEWQMSIETAAAAADLLSHCGADRLVTAVVQDDEWSRPVPLDAAGMRVLARGLAMVDDVCADFNVVQTLHPHVDTLVETKRDVQLALDICDVSWCLDTGHLAIGGYDPLEFVRDHADRIEHVHLKDVNLALAERTLTREISLLEAVHRGIFVPLGTGDVAVAEIIANLEKAGYTGRYVLEQDIAVIGAPPEVGSGPVEDVAKCIRFIEFEVEPLLVRR